MAAAIEEKAKKKKKKGKYSIPAVHGLKDPSGPTIANRLKKLRLPTQWKKNIKEDEQGNWHLYHCWPRKHL
jgi:hypothetical protein